MIAGRKTVGTICGRISYGGQSPSRAFLRRYTGYVEQTGAPPLGCATHCSSRPTECYSHEAMYGMTKGLRLHCVAADTLIGNLTVFEMLLYTADLKLPRCMPYKDKVRKVSLIISQLALTTCQHVRIGSSVQRGISGERPLPQPAL